MAESRRLRTQAERHADGTTWRVGGVMAGETSTSPRLYGWLPCVACGSDRHYLDDCDNADAVAAYYADEDD